MNLQGPILEKGKVFWIPAAFQPQIFQAAFVQELIFYGLIMCANAVSGLFPRLEFSPYNALTPILIVYKVKEAKI